MSLNLSQLNDLIDIQGDIFRQNLNDFDPKKLIDSVIAETTDLFDLRASHHSDESIPKTLLGDEARLKYILSCLVNSARKRDDSRVTVTSYLSEEEKIFLTNETYDDGETN